jgi:hypothetical protein
LSHTRKGNGSENTGRSSQERLSVHGLGRLGCELHDRADGMLCLRSRYRLM